MKNSMLTMGLAALLFAACSNDVTDEATQTQNDGNRYMAISLVAGASNGTRAASDGGFATSDDEYADVDAVYFYFYKQNGDAISVTNNGENYVKGTDFKSWDTANDLTGGNQSVTAISNVIAVLTNMNGDTPAKVVAVLNPTFTASDANNKTLDELRAMAVTSGYDATSYKNFMMTNSVYSDGTDVVYATPIKAANLATSADNAKDNPVKIYVERVVAKVTVADLTDGKMALSDGDQYLANTNLSVRVDGWQVFNTAKSTKVVKEIAGYNPTTTWTWNDATNYRSYWAVVPTDLGLNDETVTWASMKAFKEAGHAAYPFENTLATAEGVDNHTSVAIAGTLVDADGDAVSIARWLSKYYTEADLKVAVANYLANDLYKYTSDDTGKSWKSISADDITFEEGAKSYEAKVVVATEGITWTAKNSEDAVDPADLAKTVPTIRLWKDGKCYYYAEITHLNNEPAVVRNHQYQLNIKSVLGLGTPVIKEDSSFDPLRPDEEQTWYLDAELYVQDWKVVNNSLDLVTTNPTTK